LQSDIPVSRDKVKGLQLKLKQEGAARQQLTGLHRQVVISLENALFDKKSIIKPILRLAVHIAITQQQPSYKINQIPYGPSGL
jgi:hypothetical protein